ncbi:MAG: hypothetical protein K2M10_04980 [Muribaculaceae bacterium]|nr:hypothetical protein [Muribaculaceae bacterium]
MRDIANLFAGIFLPATLLCCGCIHTYPDAEAIDPTMIEVELAVNPRLNLQPLEINASEGNKEGRSGISGWALWRTIVEVRHPSGESKRCLTTLFRNNASSDPLTVRLPWKLAPQCYELSIWSDCVDSSDSTEVYFKAADLRNVTIMPYTPDMNNVLSIPPLLCASATETLDLRENVGKQNAKINVPVEAAAPFGIIKIVADDTDLFTGHHPEVAYNPKAYSVELKFTSPYPDAFNVATGEPSRYLTSATFSSPLFIPDASASTLISVPVFPSSGGENLTADVTIYNSARSIISRTKDVAIPVCRDRTIVVRGGFLSNFFANQIKVENEWEDEIIIDLSEDK